MMNINMSNNLIIQTLDGIFPVLTSALPENVREKHLCSILYDNLKSFNTDTARKLSEQLVFDDDKPNKTSPFICIIKICEYLHELVTTSNDDYESRIKTVKQLDTILSLPSRVIIEKNIDFKLANLNVTNTIKKSIINGFTHEQIDKVLHFAHTLIFKFFSLKVSELSLTEILKILDELTVMDKIKSISTDTYKDN